MEDLGIAKEGLKCLEEYCKEDVRRGYDGMRRVEGQHKKDVRRDK